jgi:hypothetical protein
MELKTMQFFCLKGGYSLFWILGPKKSKRVPRGPHEDIPENFGISHSIISK